jgi:hypothetical protein
MCHTFVMRPMRPTRPTRPARPRALLAVVLGAATLVWATPARGAPESHAPRDLPDRPAPTDPAATPRPEAPTRPQATTPPVKDAPRKAPVQGYVSRGVRSRFCFGVGVHMGINSLTNAGLVLAGVSAHFRASGVAGVMVEYDFNRVASTPSPTDLSIEALHFIPNLRVAAVLYPYRWRMLGPFILFGLGIDTLSREDRANFQVGFGLEVTFWHDRLAIVAEFRAFIPRPTDVEKHKERLEITGAPNIPKTREYYNVDNLLFTLSARFYY